MNLLDAQNESFLMKVDLLSVKWVEVQAPLEAQFCTKKFVLSYNEFITLFHEFWI